MNIREEDLRNAIYDILFEQQGGVHNGNGSVDKANANELMHKLTRKLRIRPVSLKPFYTVHWEGDEEHSFPHIKSHITGRTYEIKKQAAFRVNNSWVYTNADDKDLKDEVASYERNRGIGLFS